MHGQNIWNFEYQILSMAWSMPAIQAEKSSKLHYLIHTFYLEDQNPFD